METDWQVLLFTREICTVYLKKTRAMNDCIFLARACCTYQLLSENLDIFVYVKVNRNYISDITRSMQNIL